MSNAYPQPYPLQALPMLVQRPALEVMQRVQAPDALIGMSFLATMAIACQGLVDVRLPTGQVRPVSLNQMVIAESGERKSTVDALVAAPLYDFDQEQDAVYAEILAKYKDELRAWSATDRAYLNCITKGAAKGKSTDEWKRKLIEHAKVKPKLPMKFRLIWQNVTERAIQEALAGVGASVSIHSDEGEIIFKGGSLDHLGLLNKGWDGARVIAFDRAYGENLSAHNPRVSMFLMTQAAALRRYMAKSGELSRGTGHLARYLVGWPISTQGYRFDSLKEGEWEHLPTFHQRVSELLRIFVDQRSSGKVDREILEFTEEAKFRWRIQAAKVEKELQPLGYFSDMPDFASKLMENAGRVAAIIHKFLGEAGPITADTVELAIKLVNWHADEFKRIFTPQDTVSEVQSDADKLSRYFLNMYVCRRNLHIPKNEVLQCGPVRPVRRLEAALSLMIGMGYVTIVTGARRQRYIQLQSALVSAVDSGASFQQPLAMPVPTLNVGFPNIGNI